MDRLLSWATTTVGSQGSVWEGDPDLCRGSAPIRLFALQNERGRRRKGRFCV